MDFGKVAYQRIEELEQRVSKFLSNSSKALLNHEKVFEEHAGNSEIHLRLNTIYPVGSIYLTVNAENPGSYFGGIWESWGSGRVPVGVDTNDTTTGVPNQTNTQGAFKTVEAIGGEAKHQLTVAEMPSHNHTITNASRWPQQALGSGGTRWVGNQGNEDLIITDTGGNMPHNNIQPFITCFMWKRVG